MSTFLEEYCEAKPAWAATPRLPFVAVFPGKDIDADVINNENLNRKYRQSRWLKSPLATTKKKWSDIANNYEKNADATQQKKVKPANGQTSQRQNLRRRQIIEDCTDKTDNCGKGGDATRQTKVKPRKRQNRQKLSQRQNQRKRQNIIYAKYRQIIEDCADKANNCGKDADATRQTKVKPRKRQNRQKISLPIHRQGRSKCRAAAQQDSIARLSRVKQPVGQQIYYHQSKLGRRSTIPAPTHRVEQNSLAMVCGVYM